MTISGAERLSFAAPRLMSPNQGARYAPGATNLPRPISSCGLEENDDPPISLKQRDPPPVLVMCGGVGPRPPTTPALLGAWPISLQSQRGACAFFRNEWGSQTRVALFCAACVSVCALCAV